MTQRTSLSDFLNSSPADDRLADTVLEIATACVEIAMLVRNGELAGVLGAADNINVQGEEQQKLDDISNQVFLDRFADSSTVAALASEEMDDICVGSHPQASLLLTFDPLDGSSNIDVNGAVGTIFSVLQRGSDDQQSSPVANEFLQCGEQQVCAGYCLYSSATMLVLTVGAGTHAFTLDAATGDFVLTHADMRIAPETAEFAINAAYTRHWHAPVARYISEATAGKTGARKKDFNMRWAGSMVGDVHRILCRGGIFMYPSDEKLLAQSKEGKLRLLYEANPMSMLVEQAEGAATTGVERIMTLQPHSLHQRVPVVLGSRAEVERVTEYHNGSLTGVA